MSNGVNLVRIIKELSQTPEQETVDVVLGTVLSVSPLKIQTDRLVLTESFLILSALAKEASIKVPEELLEHFTEVENPTIILWRGLNVGDTVYMIRCSQGQKYLVLQRQEGIE